jgi:FdhD protein
MPARDLGPVPALGYAAPVDEHRIVRLESDEARELDAAVATEVPVAFVFAGRTHVVMMCTPADLEDLAFGFCVTERIVSEPGDVGRVEVVKHSRGIELQIDIPASDAERLASKSRAISARTGCGICGADAIDDVLRTPPRLTGDLAIETDALWRAAASLDERQPWNRETHAIHAAAWASPDGMLRVVREDVGRHNALDKVLGALLREGVDASSGFLLVTSRASYELVLKAAASRVALLAAVSRPTSLAIQLADDVGLTLVGLLRGRTANVYAHRERLLAPEARA